LSLVQGWRDPRGSPLTATQVPLLPSTLHASHWPVHARVQQTPSTHTLDWHSPPVLHPTPAVFLPTHTPPAQYWLLLQSPSVAQLFCPPTQRSPAQVEPVGQACWSAGGQLPAPSQKAISDATPFVQSGS
jgi:hypothetical protein